MLRAIGEGHMPAATIESSFDAAQWFIERAQLDGEYLQPPKLHRLLFLAQAYYAVAYNGHLLMPAVFVADIDGPVEPGVYRASELARPKLEPRKLPADVTHFLDSIWRRFGQHSTDYINKMVAAHKPVKDAMNEGPRTIISVQAMVGFYGKRATQASKAQGVLPVSEVIRPKVLKSQTGKPVSVQKWMPGKTDV
jgi:uncharacterized phage-associated protein